MTGDGSGLVDVLRELLELADCGPPSAAEVAARIGRRAIARSVAGRNFEKPSWARVVGGADDLYLTLNGDLAGVRGHEDPRGWGAYADLAVRRGSLEDVESVVGPTQWMARNPDDFTSGERVAAYVDRSGWTVRVFTELTRDGAGVAEVSVSYPSRDTLPRPTGQPSPLIVRRAIRPPGARSSAGADADVAGAADALEPLEPGQCANCGSDIRDAGSFCGTCGVFLEWSRG